MGFDQKRFDLERRATGYLAGKGKGRMPYDPDESGLIDRHPQNQHHAMKAREALEILKEHLAKITSQSERGDHAEDPFSSMEASHQSDLISKTINRLENPKSKGAGRPKKPLPKGVSKKQIGRIAQAGRKSVSKAKDSVSDFLRGD